MIVTLKTQGLQTLEQVCAFLEGSQPLGFQAPAREAAYEVLSPETLGGVGPQQPYD